MGGDHDGSYVRISGRNYHIGPTYVLSDMDSLSYFMMTDEQRQATGYGNVSIRYDDGLEDYLLHADFKRAGDTVLTIVSPPTGEKTEYALHIERNTYETAKRSS